MNTPIRKKTNYINNVDFFNALVKFLDECAIVKQQHKELLSEMELAYNEALEEHSLRIQEQQKQRKKLSVLDLPPKEPIYPELLLPRIPEYIGKCILLISTKLSGSPNFAGYSFREDMVADGIETCILRIHNFDPNKSHNPFAYFTQLCWFAAVQRIKRENKQKSIKSELIKNSNIIDNLSSEKQLGDDAVYQNNMLSFLLENVDKIEETEEEKAATKRFKKTTKVYQKKLKERDLEIKNEETSQSRPIDSLLGEDDTSYGLESIFYNDENEIE